YVYGPVKSRRIGLSLGLSLTPHKTCNLDCLYCQLGKTKEAVGKRKEYVSIKDILTELKEWFKNNPETAKELNYITLSGSGEPTLNSELARLIDEIKKLSSASVAVITNATLLNDEKVRSDLKFADLLVPSLDAVEQEIFEKINRPQAGIKVKDIISGLVSLRKGFKGKIWLEVMLVSGINDDLVDIRKLKEVIEKIRPDKIQINSPVRTTAEAGVMAVDAEKLEVIREILGPTAEIV
ncbi:MAG: radical SAM protein, partial [Candidatus Omnitrophota bacterium]